ncbi:hypothetical protein PRUPE_2G232900 [Prunus persica]|uniref:Uncharacterized protein n=2 Tax=Prunus TaxID=3754 RepID=A0A251QKR1_PRUPE|nr:hypothetical protein PRUPE_2G232900 [Prunus persica]
MPKMKRKQLLLLVFALLMLIAPDAAESVLEFETAPARKSLVATRYMLATWLNSRKLVKVQAVHKVPSGPNPTGNQKPPSRQD